VGFNVKGVIFNITNGTFFASINSEIQTVRLVALDGSVKILGINGEMSVRVGQGVTVGKDGKTTPPLAFSWIKDIRWEEIASGLNSTSAASAVDIFNKDMANRQTIPDSDEKDATQIFNPVE
jgi:hypothetical protein